MWIRVVLFVIILVGVMGEEDAYELRCNGSKVFTNVSLAAYYPNYDGEDEREYSDIKGKKLRTLQDFLDGRTDYVTLAMDENLSIPYGTPGCIKELNQHFRRNIKLQIRDVGTDLKGTNYGRVDICVRTEEDSYDQSVNRVVTLAF